MTAFRALGIESAWVQRLVELDINQPTPIQQQTMPTILRGQDVNALAPTGTGKSLAFLLPLLQRWQQSQQAKVSNQTGVLIMVPTRELAEQLYQMLLQLSFGQPVTALAVYGGVSLNPQMLKLRKGVDFIIGTPGRLLDLVHRRALQLGAVHTLVLDEADRMLDLGFSKEVDALFGNRL